MALLEVCHVKECVQTMWLEGGGEDKIELVNSFSRAPPFKNLLEHSAFGA